MIICFDLILNVLEQGIPITVGKFRGYQFINGQKANQMLDIRQVDI